MLFFAALRRVSGRVILVAVIGASTSALLSVAWLQVPDSHVWQLLLSLVVGAAVLAGVLSVIAETLRLLRRCFTPLRFRTSVVLVGVWLVLWSLLAHVLGFFRTGIEARAYFWNSRLSAHERVFFTGARLISWQEHALLFVLWWLLPSLLLPAMLESVACGLREGRGRVVHVYGRWQLWVSIALSGWLGTTMLGALVRWHPSYTVRGEVVSATFRLGAAGVLLVFFALITAAIVAELLARSAGASSSVLRVSAGKGVRGNTAPEPAANGSRSIDAD